MRLLSGVDDLEAATVSTYREARIQRRITRSKRSSRGGVDAKEAIGWQEKMGRRAEGKKVTMLEQLDIRSPFAAYRRL